LKFNGQDVLVPLMETCPQGLPSRQNTQSILRRALSNNSESDLTEQNIAIKSTSNQSATSLDKLTQKNIEDLKIQNNELASNSEENLKMKIFFNNIREYFSENFSSKVFKNHFSNYDSSNEKQKVSKQNSADQKLYLYEKYKWIIDEYRSILPKTSLICKLENDENTKGFDHKTENLVGRCEGEKTSEVDQDDCTENVSNKRFYHVFKKEELNQIIFENCKDLVIYDSFYDHGNWCICALKLK